MKCKCGCGKDIGKIDKYYPNKVFCKGHRLSPKLKIIQCDFCHKTIQKRFPKCSSHLKHRFCSKQCCANFKKQQNIKICLYCKKPFHRKGTASFKFCSLSCWYKYNVGEKNHSFKPCIILKCKNCNNNFYKKEWEKSRKFCSPECRRYYQSKYCRGKNHPMWKGGISPETNLRCSSLEWKILRQKIYKRDNFTCQKCGLQARDYKNFPLAVHHVVPFRISKNNNPENLLTLCRWCHTKEEWKVNHFKR